MRFGPVGGPDRAAPPVIRWHRGDKPMPADTTHWAESPSRAQGWRRGRLAEHGAVLQCGRFRAQPHPELLFRPQCESSGHRACEGTGPPGPARRDGPTSGRPGRYGQRRGGRRTRSPTCSASCAVPRELVRLGVGWMEWSPAPGPVAKRVFLVGAGAAEFWGARRHGVELPGPAIHRAFVNRRSRAFTSATENAFGSKPSPASKPSQPSTF